jgi:hypothetical protein
MRKIRSRPLSLPPMPPIMLALHGAITLAMTALSPVPPALNEYSRGGRGGTLATMRRSAAAAVGRALADDLLLLEIEFPPLCETKTQFDDYSNTEVLDANRDFAVQLGLERELSAAAPDATMWMCFADDGESELAREAWPGTIYKEATITSISAAVSASGADPFKPFGSWAVKSKAEEEVAKAKLAPVAALQLIVQPGDGGPIEDWLNLELLRKDSTPMVCVNGALDKVTSGYYSNFLNPKLAQCSERFFTKFEQVYYCKPVGAGRGWLFRVYPEPWQLYRQTREELELVETYETRPKAADCTERLKRP